MFSLSSIYFLFPYTSLFRSARDAPHSARAAPAGSSRAPAAAAGGPCRRGRGSPRRSPGSPPASPTGRTWSCSRSSAGDLTGLGADGDGQSHGVAPLCPRAVVVAHVLEAQQVLQGEPGVGGALADAAVGDHRLCGIEAELAGVDRLELGARAETAGLGGGAGPGHGGRGGDRAVAPGARLP